MADSTLSAKSASPREPKRPWGPDDSTCAGTPSSIAALMVQRPSPESDTRPANCESCGSWIKAAGGRTSSQAASNGAPRRPPPRRRVRVELVLLVLAVAERRGLRVDNASPLADVGRVEDRQPLGVGRHHAVLDAVVHHLDEVAGATRPAVQVALLRCSAGPVAPRRARDVA